ncbi:cation:dicarboxylase symporter family transporter [Erythrobacter gaetbuli]|uniref:Cation:dicarboxylase symporter family transporter n=1 Tax=Qipengyuania gaetbuli TaxID=266952 RepID=A0A844XV17_9SPHN|nr:cation:dicarboxylase symporter family transporter [Qipengyuania gaetbuli]MXO49741.1 cation:dicarboxylase symporter family transporter [Qipengyuania gaetbuli]
MSGATRILAALVFGLILGLTSTAIDASWTKRAIPVAELVGGIWLDALKMTIIPLVVALLVTSISASTEVARTSRLAGISLISFVALLGMSALLSAFLTPALLQAWPLSAEFAAGLSSGLPGIEKRPEVVGFADFLRAIVPSNPIAAAANDAILPVIVFTIVFAFALTRLPDEPRQQLSSFFKALSALMLIMIGWILWLAPIGVLALAYTLGARAGLSAFGALLHYIVLVSSVGLVIWLLAYLLAVFGAKLSFTKFASAVAPAQAVAISTQSSLASLPAMLRGAETLGVSPNTSGTVLPLAVAVFRVTGPAMNLAVVLYIAHWLGVAVGPAQLAAAIVTAAITSMGSPSLPGQIGFITATAPIAIAAGVPIEPLLLLVAVENIPDVVRTFGNVTMNVAATATFARRVKSSLPA